MPFLLFLNAVSFTLVFGHEDNALVLGKRLGTLFFLYLLTLVLLVVAVHFARDAWLERKLRARSEARSRARSASGMPPRKAAGRAGRVTAFLLVTYWLFAAMLAAISAFGPRRLDDDERVLWLLGGAAAALAALLVKLADDSTSAERRARHVRERRAATEKLNRLRPKEKP